MRQESLKTLFYITNMSVSPEPGLFWLKLPVQFHDTILPTTQSKPESPWSTYGKDKPIFPNCVHITNLKISGK